MYAVPDQTGKLAVVTGANSGTGKEAAARLAAAGAHVVMAVRTPAKGEAGRAEILARAPGRPARGAPARPGRPGLGPGVRRRLIADGAPVDLLLNNAGVMARAEAG